MVGGGAGRRVSGGLPVPLHGWRAPGLLVVACLALCCQLGAGTIGIGKSYTVGR
jgi:hypothetical protein